MDPTMMIHDVQEKEIGVVKPPSFPLPKSGTTGFPEHKKRTRVSAFKAKKQAQQQDASKPTLPTSGAGAPSQTTAVASEQNEQQRIDLENRQRMKDMSPQEIEEAQQELLSGLDPALIQMLLKRANLDDPATSANSPFAEDAKTAEPIPEPPRISVEDTDKPPEKTTEAKPKKTVSFADEPESEPRRPSYDEDARPAAPPSDLFPISSSEAQQGYHDHDHDHDHKSTHFPTAPSLPDLDPADPSFLQTLHDKYFPNLPSDPSKLAWMAPLPTEHSPADRDSPYYPRQDSLPVSQLRFDFRGALLPPRISRAIPATRGLHHHGEAPEAAGYTVLELARLARSVVPAQRCIAFQTLGRILYRLGGGEWGAGDDELAMGLWRCAQEGRVLETLNEAAGVEEGRGHQGVRAYAIEAVWLFEKGGWRERWRGR